MLFRSFILICTCIGKAQKGGEVLPTEFERGELSEIKNLHRAYLKVASPNHYEVISQELAKYENDVQLVSDPNEADFVIAFAIERESGGLSTSSPSVQRWLYYARIMVYVPKDRARPRVVWKTSRLFSDLLNKEFPITTQRADLHAVQAFIKALKKIRREK